MKGRPRESDGGAEVISQSQSDGAPTSAAVQRRFSSGRDPIWGKKKKEQRVINELCDFTQHSNVS